MVEVVEMENKKLEFIESEDNKTFLFRDPIDYDDYNFDAKFVKDLIKWMNRMYLLNGMVGSLTWI